MVFLFIDVIFIRRRYRDRFLRSRIASDWLFYACSLVGTIASIFGVSVIFISPWTNTPGQVLLTTVQWDIWIAGIAVASLLVAVVGFYIGHHIMQSDLSDEDIITIVTN
jgi:glutamate:GABA antiporter